MPHYLLRSSAARYLVLSCTEGASRSLTGLTYAAACMLLLSDLIMIAEAL